MHPDTQDQTLRAAPCWPVPSVAASPSVGTVQLQTWGHELCAACSQFPFVLGPTPTAHPSGDGAARPAELLSPGLLARK